MSVLLLALVAGGVGALFGRWFDRHLACRIGVHDWRNGPGFPCCLCGAADDFWRNSP